MISLVLIFMFFLVLRRSNNKAHNPPWYLRTWYQVGQLLPAQTTAGQEGFGADPTQVGTGQVQSGTVHDYAVVIETVHAHLCAVSHAESVHKKTVQLA